MYGMGHKKVPSLCVTTIVQRKFCVPCSCSFRCKNVRAFFVASFFLYNGAKNGAKNVEKNGAKNVEKNGAESVEKKEPVSPSISLPRAGSEEDCT